MKKRNITLSILASLLITFTSCEQKEENSSVVKDPQENELLVDAADIKNSVSPYLMGFNTIYSFEKDAYWEDGQGIIPQQLKKFNTGIIRYPGGAVTGRYHWNNLNGQGWMDNWDPNYDASNDLAPEDYMDLEEYMKMIQEVGAEPMVGVNMGSGMKFDRVQDGVDEAKALVQHCLDKGYNVKYYYMDNEAYHKGAAYQMTAEEYAEQINLYVPELKKVDPNIEIIVNWKNNISKGSQSMEILLEAAGSNIDVMEIHWYWEHGNSVFDKWLNSFPMSSKSQYYGGEDYVREILAFKPILNRVGYPNIKLACNEWNLGPTDDAEKTPTKFESALMLSEMFAQFIDGGLFMANFWGVQWPQGEGSKAVNRYLFDPTDNMSVNPLSEVFEFYASAMGGEEVKCSSVISGVYDIAVVNEKKDELYIYIVNKQQDEEGLATGINLRNFDFNEYKVVSFIEDESNLGFSKNVETPLSVENNERLMITLPKNSFTKITLIK